MMILHSGSASSGIGLEEKNPQEHATKLPSLLQLSVRCSNSSPLNQGDESPVISPVGEIDEEEEDIVEKARRLVFSTFSTPSSRTNNHEIEDMSRSQKVLGSGPVDANDGLHIKDHFHSSADEGTVEPPRVQKVSHWLDSCEEGHEELETDNPQNCCAGPVDFGKIPKSSTDEIKSYKQVWAINLINQSKGCKEINKRYPLEKYSGMDGSAGHVKHHTVSASQSSTSGSGLTPNSSNESESTADIGLHLYSTNFKIWNYFCRSSDLSDEARRGTVLEALTEAEAEELFKKIFFEGMGGVYKPPVSIRSEVEGGVPSRRNRFGKESREVIGAPAQVSPDHDRSVRTGFQLQSLDFSCSSMDVSSKSVANYSSNQFGLNNFGEPRYHFTNSPIPTGGFGPDRNYRLHSRKYYPNSRFSTNRTAILPPAPPIFSSEEYEALSIHCSKYASSCDDKTHVQLIAWLILNEKKVGQFDPREINSMVMRLVQHTGNLSPKEAKLKELMEGCLERDGDLNYYRETHIDR